MLPWPQMATVTSRRSSCAPFFDDGPNGPNTVGGRSMVGFRIVFAAKFQRTACETP